MATTYAEIAQKLATKKGQVEEELKTTTEPTKKATLKLLLQKITAALQKLKDSQKMHPEAEDPMAQMQGQQGQQQMPQQMPMPQQQMAQQQVPQQQMLMPQPGMQPGMPQQMQQGMQQPMGYAQTGGYLPQFQSPNTGIQDTPRDIPIEEIKKGLATGEGVPEEESIGLPETYRYKPEKRSTLSEIATVLGSAALGSGAGYLLGTSREKNQLKNLKSNYAQELDKYNTKKANVPYYSGNHPLTSAGPWAYTAHTHTPYQPFISEKDYIKAWEEPFKKRSAIAGAVLGTGVGLPLNSFLNQRRKKKIKEREEEMKKWGSDGVFEYGGDLPEYFSGGDLDWGSVGKATLKGAGAGLMAAGPWGLLTGLVTGGADIATQFMTGEAGEAQTKLDEAAAKQEEVQKGKYKALTRFIKPAKPTDPFYTASLPRGKSWQSIEGGKIAPNRKTPFYQESNTDLPMYDLQAWNALDNNALDNEEENNKKPPLTPAEKQERAGKRRKNLSDILYMIQKYGPVAGNMIMGTGEKDYYPGFYTPQAPLNFDPARNLLGESAEAFRQAGKYDPRASLSAAANARDRGIYNAQNTASPSTALALQNEVTGNYADRISRIYADAGNKNRAAKIDEGQGLAGLGQVEAGLAGRENQWMQDAYGLATTEQSNVWNQRALLDALGRQFLQQGIMDISKGAQTDKLMAGKQYNDLIKSGLLESMFRNYSYDKDNPLGGIGFNDYASGVSDT